MNGDDNISEAEYRGSYHEGAKGAGVRKLPAKGNDITFENNLLDTSNINN
tara:strand:+ start:1376 stop:1525 length:150 start_codon:yes stop_codon:yes gene_type:complete